VTKTLHSKHICLVNFPFFGCVSSSGTFKSPSIAWIPRNTHYQMFLVKNANLLLCSCLLGVFGVHMPLIYGEGSMKAFHKTTGSDYEAV
jgi:hypothetical protein